MITKPLVVCLATTFCAILAAEPSDPDSGPGADVAAADRLASMNWLAGCWQGPYERGEWEACYSSSIGGVIVSANKEIVGGRVVMIEFERFTIENDDVILTPYPHGKKNESTFKLVEHDPKASKAVFVNPEHDFPNRIVYERTAPNRLVIQVIGRENDQDIKLTLNLTRKD